MDGNRRYAKSIKQKTMVGHKKGFDQMLYVLEFCLELGIDTVTVFAFSLDNFQRSPDEVEGLMQLSLEKFTELQDQTSLLFSHGIRVRVIGDISMLDPQLQECILKLEQDTSTHTRVLLNICMAYSSINEIYKSYINQDTFQDSDLTTQKHGTASFEGRVGRTSVIEPNSFRALNDVLSGGALPTPLDLIVRTSGEFRLSDFLLEQASSASQSFSTINVEQLDPASLNCLENLVKSSKDSTVQLAFLDCMWPELTCWDLIKVFLNYQSSLQ